MGFNGSALKAYLDTEQSPSLLTFYPQNFNELGQNFVLLNPGYVFYKCFNNMNTTAETTEQQSGFTMFASIPG